MQVPAIPYRKPVELDEPEFGPSIVGAIGALALLSMMVWGLAIAKLIDLYGSL